MKNLTPQEIAGVLKADGPDAAPPAIEVHEWIAEWLPNLSADGSHIAVSDSRWEGGNRRDRQIAR